MQSRISLIFFFSLVLLISAISFRNKNSNFWLSENEKDLNLILVNNQGIQEKISTIEQKLDLKNRKIEALISNLQKPNYFSIRIPKIEQSAIYFAKYSVPYEKRNDNIFSVSDFKGRRISSAAGPVIYHLAGLTDLRAGSEVLFTKQGIELNGFVLEFRFQEKSWGATHLVPIDKHDAQFIYKSNEKIILSPEANTERYTLIRDFGQDSLLGDSLWISNFKVLSVDSISFDFSLLRSDGIERTSTLFFEVNEKELLTCPELNEFHDYSRMIFRKMIN